MRHKHTKQEQIQFTAARSKRSNNAPISKLAKQPLEVNVCQAWAWLHVFGNTC